MPDLVIAATAVAERDAFDAAHAEGILPLWDALIACTFSGAPISKRMREKLMFAYAEYQAGKYDDLAEPLGVRLTAKQKRALNKHFRDEFIRGMVDEAAAGEKVWLSMPGEEKIRRVTLKKKPRTEDPTKAGVRSAFDRAAEIFGLSPSRIKKIDGARQIKGRVKKTANPNKKPKRF